MSWPPIQNSKAHEYPQILPSPQAVVLEIGRLTFALFSHISLSPSFPSRESSLFLLQSRQLLAPPYSLIPPRLPPERSWFPTFELICSVPRICHRFHLLGRYRFLGWLPDSHFLKNRFFFSLSPCSEILILTRDCSLILDFFVSRFPPLC